MGVNILLCKRCIPIYKKHFLSNLNNFYPGDTIMYNHPPWGVQHGHGGLQQKKTTYNLRKVFYILPSIPPHGKSYTFLKVINIAHIIKVRAVVLLCKNVHNKHKICLSVKWNKMLKYTSVVYFWELCIQFPQKNFTKRFTFFPENIRGAAGYF